MSKSIKDALQQAGFKASRQENERPKLAKKQITKKVKHQETRNYCEVCNNILPDVEKYQHNNPTIRVQWICARCADINQIPDRTRVTSQSEFSKTGIFHREFH